MFDLITGKAIHTPYTPAVPILVSTAAHMAVAGLLIVLPWLYLTDQLPTPSTMVAFVAAPPAPPSPPPPPPRAPAPARSPVAKPVPTARVAAPIEAPAQVVSEPPAPDFGEEGIPGGVEGGIPGGVIGGIVGGFTMEIPPPPPPAPPAPRGPIRIGGEIQQPALVYRVEPVYPAFAVAAHIEGMVILEAIVNEEGRVEDLKVLRSIRVLDQAALAAVRQWRYSPVLLNGRPEKFILTVVVSFKLKDE